MKVSDLKKIIEVPVSNVSKNGINKYCEFINIKKTDDNFVIQSYNGTSAVETFVSKDFDLFTGCVLALDLSKFLNTLNNDDNVTFEEINNIIVIKYGKKGKFNLKTIPDREFPTVSIKGLCTINTDLSLIKINDELVGTLSTALNYCSKSMSYLYGVFIVNGNIYSTDRSVLYKSINNLGDINTFLPIELVKFIIKFKDYINDISLFERGFLVKGKSLNYWHPNIECTVLNFNKILDKVSFKDPFIDMNDNIIKAINRVTEFSEFVKFIISDKSLTIGCDNMSEVIDTEYNVSDDIVFRISSSYLKNVIKVCNSVKLYQESSGDIKFIKCDDLNGKFEIIVATIV